MTRKRMFARLLWRSLAIRRGRATTALLAIVVAAAVTTAMLNLFVDVQSKLRHEFRSYGANIVIAARENSPLPADALRRTDAVLAGHGIAVPFSYAVARTTDGSPIVVAGTDMERVRALNPWWKVSAWPTQSGSALLGSRATPILARDDKPFTLSFQGKAIRLTSAGTLSTGAAEDSRVYLPLNEFEAWTGVQPAYIEVGVNGSGDEVSRTMRQLAVALPEADVKPVRQVAETEARVLAKTHLSMLASTLIIVLTTMLCMVATLITWVLDRRREFAVMKALGASERMVSALFGAEAAVLGGVGSLAGYAIGAGVAAWIGRANFNAPVAPRLELLPIVIAGSVAISLIASVLPIAMLRRVQPATILRGE
jgi:putative ABC transport system permease protein